MVLNRPIMIDEGMVCTRYWEFSRDYSRIPIGHGFRVAASVSSACRLALEAIAIGLDVHRPRWDGRPHRSVGLVRATALEVDGDSRERPDAPDGVACRSETRSGQPCHPTSRCVGDATEGLVAAPEASGWVRKQGHSPRSKLVACGRDRRKQRQRGRSQAARRISNQSHVSSSASLNAVEVVTDVLAEWRRPPENGFSIDPQQPRLGSESQVGTRLILFGK